MEIKFREILISFVIFIGVLLLGFPITNCLNNYADDFNSKLNKAVHIQDEEAFQYGMRTEIGDSFSYGTLIANEPVYCDYFEGPSAFLKIEREKYCQHTRTVTHSNEKVTWTTQETYWSWDHQYTNYYSTDTYEFLGTTINANSIDLFNDSYYVDTYSAGHHLRDVVYRSPSTMTGTLRADLKKDLQQTQFYNNKTIAETINFLTVNNFLNIIVWILLFVLGGFLVYFFIERQNDWLD